MLVALSALEKDRLSISSDHIAGKGVLAALLNSAFYSSSTKFRGHIWLSLVDHLISFCPQKVSMQPSEQKLCHVGVFHFSRRSVMFKVSSNGGLHHGKKQQKPPAHSFIIPTHVCFLNLVVRCSMLALNC